MIRERKGGVSKDSTRGIGTVKIKQNCARNILSVRIDSKRAQKILDAYRDFNRYSL